MNLSISGGAEVLHDQHTGSNVLSYLDGDVHSLLADMARSDLSCQAHEGQYLLSYGG